MMVNILFLIFNEENVLTLVFHQFSIICLSMDEIETK